MSVAFGSNNTDALTLTGSGVPNRRNITFMCWVCPTVLANAHILTVLGSTIDGTFPWSYENGTPLGMFYQTTGGALHYDGTEMNVGQWYACGFSVDSLHNYRERRLGQVLAQGAGEADTATAPNIFGFGAVGSFQGFGMRLAAVKIYNRVLTVAEWALEEKSVLPVSRAGLYDFWPLRTVNDLRGGLGHLLTVQGAPVTGPDQPPAPLQFAQLAAKTYTFSSPAAPGGGGSLTVPPSAPSLPVEVPGHQVGSGLLR